MLNLLVLKITESRKSALIKVSKKVGPFVSEIGIGYLYFEQDMSDDDKPSKGDSFPYEGEVEFTPLVDLETGEVRTSKSGDTLNRVVLK